MYSPTPPLAGLRQLRYERALTQDDLAKAAAVSRNAISEFENGLRRAQPKTIRALARALKVKPSELYG